MKLQTLFTERRAVSPVIGVILMVAITVILAAVIGTFVLGLGDQVGDTAPNANWGAEFDANGGENGTVTFTHQGGDAVEASELSITASDSTVFEAMNAAEPSDARLAAGDTISREISDNFGGTTTANLVWEKGDRSSILRSITITVD
ncbi:Pilin/Flagellin, FlaG/FlaF family [Halalkaliarchaeum sp. AArc-CO]|uniref:type IV pilin N-terminal domain-containing protein n=1 Tax=Halalkaliarchaeum sp. AArc-CO TaxID=2866381 RepID=UPI00217D3402|nr:type IV pilin N-terminal domain-containing protein [Halalkaliarchaeum sp. AArc-CO]UWG51277.1 Pilin/Flagellin, FlaG/FlaF family [Halalkaliarchaeum sp. AArc-CO]